MVAFVPRGSVSRPSNGSAAHFPRAVAACVLALASVAPATALAEPQPSADLRGSFAPMHHDAGVAIEPAGSPDTGELTGSVRFWYAYRPVVLRDAAGNVAFSVVEHQFTGDVGLAVGLFGRATLGLDLPVLMAQVGDDPRQNEAAERLLGSSEVPLTSIGDPAIRAKVTLVQPQYEGRRLSGLAIGADERVTLPLADERSFLGEGSVTSETRVLIDYGFAPLSLHFATGVKMREDSGAFACDPDQLLDDCTSRFGHEIPFVLGTAIHPHALGIDPDEVATLFVETYGRIPINPVTPDESTQPLQWYASLAGRLRVGDVAFLGAVQLGLMDGIGTAPFRAMLGVSFAPRSRDTDHDGFADEDDKCPTMAEDRDAFELDDGCPEMDDDGDGKPD